MYLSNDLINCISKFLNVIELSNFERYLESHSKGSIFKHNLNIKFPKIKHIKKFYSDLAPELFNETFYESLTKSNAFISGSSVLQAIIGEKWNDFDIDIYQPCTKECCNNQIEFYGEGENKFSRVPFSPIENYLWKNCVQDIYSYDNYTLMSSLGIHIIRKYKFSIGKKDLIIQVINVQNEINLKKFIIDKFDFKFCMNTFDGKTLYIRNSKSITKKRSKITTKCSEFIAEVRCQKYYSRGFKIIGYDLTKPVELDIDNPTFDVYSSKIIYPTKIIIDCKKFRGNMKCTRTVARGNKNIELVLKNSPS